MGTPSHARAASPHLQRGRWSPSRPEPHRAAAGRAPAHGLGGPLDERELQALRRWLHGRATLRPQAARHLLERVVRHRQWVHQPALHWRAVKTALAGEANWVEMGLRLTLDPAASGASAAAPAARRHAAQAVSSAAAERPR